MNDVIHLDTEIKRIEPSLEEVMRFQASCYPEAGLRLRHSVCGFASNVLGKYLKSRTVVDPMLKIGIPADVPERLPQRMRRHVLVDSGIATIDPTWGQFMSLVGLDIDLARHSAMRDLYPERQVAVIPRGFERVFGERFATFALGRVAEIASIRRSMGPDAPWSTDDICVWMPEDEAFETLADIWNPGRYKTFDNQGDGEAVAECAAQRLLALTAEDV